MRFGVTFLRYQIKSRRRCHHQYPFGHGTTPTCGFGGSTIRFGESASAVGFGGSTHSCSCGVSKSTLGSTSGAFATPTFASTTTSPFDFRGFGDFGHNHQAGSHIRPYSPTAEPESREGKLISISAMDVYNNKSHEELRLEDYKHLRNNAFAPAPVAYNILNWLNSTRPAATNGLNVVAQDQNNLPQSSNSKSRIFPVQDSQSNPTNNVFPGFQVPYFPSFNTTPSLFRKPNSPSTHASQSTGTSSSVPLTSTNVEANAIVNYNTQPFAFHYFPAFVSFIHPGVISSAPLLGTQLSPATMSFGGPTTNFTMHDGPNQTHLSSPASVPLFGGLPTNVTTCDGPNLTHSNSPASVPVPAFGSFGGPSTIGTMRDGPNQTHSSSLASVPGSAFVSFGGPATIGTMRDGPNQTQSNSPASVPLFGNPPRNGNICDGPNQTHSNSPASVPGPAFGSFGGPSTIDTMRDGPNQTQSNSPASVPGPDIRPFGSPTLTSVSSSIAGTNSYPSARNLFPEPTFSSSTQEANKISSFAPSLHESACSNELKAKEVEDICCVPKGLEIIAEMLDFNPWSQEKGNANKLDSEVGPILPCVDAHQDEDIITLAEFAVEQHNALHKDDSVKLMKVVAACLEAVEGGKYHIVLDTIFSGPGFMPPKRHYAVVVRKATRPFNNLMVLQQWL